MNSLRMKGIDLGTTNSLIAQYNKDGTYSESDLLQSIVNLKNRNVGAKAKEDLLQRGDAAVTFSYKPDIGMTYSNTASYAILKTLRDTVNDESEKVVVTVPAYFNTHQRESTIEAAKRAGYSEVHLINEPTAAVLAAAKNLNGLFLVYDLGGGTFDVSLVDVSDKFSVIKTQGINKGGDNLDRHIASRVETEYILATGKDLTEVEKKQLYFAVAKAKHEIQATGEDVDIEFVAGGEEHSFGMTLNQYKTDLYNVFKPTFNLIESCVHDISEKFNLMFVGGSTRCPYLRDMVSSHLRMLDKDFYLVKQTYNPDRIVAEGAAYAAYLIENEEFAMVTDIAKSIGIILVDDNDEEFVFNIIKEGEILPTFGSTYVGLTPNNTTMFDIVEDLPHNSKITSGAINETNKLGYMEIPSEDSTFCRVDVRVSRDGTIEVAVKKDSSLDVKSIKICKN